jgi:hypothetical protein
MRFICVMANGGAIDKVYITKPCMPNRRASEETPEPYWLQGLLCVACSGLQPANGGRFRCIRQDILNAD